MTIGKTRVMKYGDFRVGTYTDVTYVSDYGVAATWVERIEITYDDGDTAWAKPGEYEVINENR